MTTRDNKFGYEVSAIKLVNFMGYADSGWLELRPITLLFGINSSGKSALIRALLLLKQSMSSRKSEFPLNFVGDFVDLGSFQRVIFQQNTALDLEFAFRLSQPTLREREENEKEEAYEDYCRDYEASRASWTKPEKINVEPSPISIHLKFGLLPDGKEPRLKAMSIVAERKANEGNKEINVFELSYKADDLIWEPSSDAPLDYRESVLHDQTSEQRFTVHVPQFSKKLWKGINLSCQNGFFPVMGISGSDIRQGNGELLQDYENAQSSLQFIREHVQDFLTNIEYIPPLRGEAQRYYRLDVAWVRDSPTSSTAINNWLKQSGSKASFELSHVNESEGLFGVYLSEPTNANQSASQSVKSNLRDVGSGFAQAFPIVVACQRAQPNSFVIIEQPELHLHPNAQAELADSFIESLQEPGCRFLIETHSSSMINRMRRRVAEKELKSSDLAALYVERDGVKSTCSIIRFSEQGDYIGGYSKLDTFFGKDIQEYTLMKTAGLSDLDKAEMLHLYQSLKKYENLFDGETIDLLFHLLGVHPSSAVRMIGTWAEHITKKFAKDKGVYKDNDTFNAVTKKLVDTKIIEVLDEKRLNELRDERNDAMHGSINGIVKLEVEDAFLALRKLKLCLDVFHKPKPTKRV